MTSRATASMMAPIFPVSDVPAALEHYRRLGFQVRSYDDAAEYGFAERDEVSLHLIARVASSYPTADAIAIAYLFVDDADGLHREWTSSGAGGSLYPPENMPWRVREGRHIDPDGNIIRFGHQLPAPPPG